MKRAVFAFLALLLVLSFGYAATSIDVDYGDHVSRTFELNDSLPLHVTVRDVPAHVHQVFVDVSDDLTDHVYCAPGLVSHDANDSWDADFTCILLPGTYDGDVYFRVQHVDVNSDNGEPLATAKVTRLSLSVTRKEVWYTNYGYTNIGGSITVGPYKIKVSDADTVTADVTIYKGTAPVWAGVMFIGQEVSPADDITVIFNGYSEKRGQAYFTFKTRFPAAVSSSVEKYYIAVPNVVYADDSNKARIDLKTNCSTIELCDSNNHCTEHDVGENGTFSTLLKVGDYTVKCKGTDISEQVHVMAPVVITKTVKVEKNVDPSQICPSWFYGLPAASRMSYCSSVCPAQPARPSSATSWTSPKSSDTARWVGLLILVAIVGWYVWKKYKEGGFGGGSKQFEETEKEVEAVPDIEG